SLRRRIDVVPASWLDTVEYQQGWDKKYRGVMILDAKARVRIANFPFLHNHHIDLRDQRSGGALRRAIRFLKNVKADGEVEVSSYDIASFCYWAPESRYYDEWS